MNGLLLLLPNLEYGISSDNLFRRPRYLLKMPSDKSRPLSSNLYKKATRHKKRTLMPDQRNYRTTEYQISSIEKLQNLFYISSIQSQLQNQRPRTISNIFYLSTYNSSDSSPSQISPPSSECPNPHIC